MGRKSALGMIFLLRAATSYWFVFLTKFPFVLVLQRFPCGAPAQFSSWWTQEFSSKEQSKKKNSSRTSHWSNTLRCSLPSSQLHLMESCLKMYPTWWKVVLKSRWGSTKLSLLIPSLLDFAIIPKCISLSTIWFGGHQTLTITPLVIIAAVQSQGGRQCEDWFICQAGWAGDFQAYVYRSQFSDGAVAADLQMGKQKMGSHILLKLSTTASRQTNLSFPKLWKKD